MIVRCINYRTTAVRVGVSFDIRGVCDFAVLDAPFGIVVRGFRHGVLNGVECVRMPENVAMAASGVPKITMAMLLEAVHAKLNPHKTEAAD